MIREKRVGMECTYWDYDADDSSKDIGTTASCLVTNSGTPVVPFLRR
jgi:hypothetical protein